MMFEDISLYLSQSVSVLWRSTQSMHSETEYHLPLYMTYILIIQCSFVHSFRAGVVIRDD